MSRIDIPDAFVFTKMQTDAGESIDAIRKRKELERLAGGGAFWWGIGESKGEAISALCAASMRPQVLFSLMLSAPSAQSREPGGVLLWQAFRTPIGVAPLPPHVVVTSGALTRAGNTKRAYYALVCRSESSIQRSGGGTLDTAALRNIGEHGKPIGSSQVTAVVRRVSNDRVARRLYKIAARANLVAPFFVTLTSPRSLSEPERELLRQAGLDGFTAQDWVEVAQRLRRL